MILSKDRGNVSVDVINTEYCLEIISDEKAIEKIIDTLLEDFSIESMERINADYGVNVVVAFHQYNDRMEHDFDMFGCWPITDTEDYLPTGGRYVDEEWPPDTTFHFMVDVECEIIEEIGFSEFKVTDLDERELIYIYPEDCADTSENPKS